MNAPAKKDWKSAIQASQHQFQKFELLNFDKEQIFATQICMNNEYVLNIATQNPNLLSLAMYNVAAIGLSLNPSEGLAYLVPRKGKIIVDISYRGLIKLGVECGAIRWAKAELVYDKDDFTYHGPNQKPSHSCDPFSKDRGEVRGGYCLAELTTGGILVEVMSKADMDKIRDSSEAYKSAKKKNKTTTWDDWEDQMQLKSVVKRAYKWWPKSTPRMAEAMRILNEDNGEGLATLAQDSAPAVLPDPPPADQVSVSTRKSVRNLINRAVEANAFSACKELMETRIKNPDELAYGLYELEKAQQAATTQNNVITVN